MHWPFPHPLLLFPPTSSKGWRFALALLLSMIYLEKLFLLSHTGVATLSSSQILALLIFCLSNILVILLSVLPLLPKVMNSFFFLGKG